MVAKTAKRKPWPAEKIERRKVAKLVPYARNARLHSKAQVAKIAASITEWGWTTPVLIDPRGQIIAGHGRVLAAQSLGIAEVPCMVATGWTKAQKQAYVIADNQLTLDASWDNELLKVELGELRESDFDVSLIGFEDRALRKIFHTAADVLEDEPPPVPKRAKSKTGQLYALGDHRLLIGDSTDQSVVEKLLPDEQIGLTLADPPWGVGIDYESHDDTLAEVNRIATSFVPHAIERSRVVAITPGTCRICSYPQSDWVLCFHFGGQAATRWGFSCWQPVLVWGKDPYLAAGEGSRPDTFNAGGMLPEAGLDHPCPKPVKVWAWIIERCGFNTDTVYDPFIGSGTSIVAAEQLGRKCYGIEIEPRYADCAIKRWEIFTRRKATLVG